MAGHLGLELLTVMGMPPVEHIRLAAELGCTSISTGLTRAPMALFGRPEVYPDWSLLDDRALRADVLAALTDNGVHVGLGEGFRVAEGLDVARYDHQLEIMAELGARRINGISTEFDEGRSTDQFGRLGEMVRDLGMRFVIEFSPGTALADPAAALRVADALGHDHCGITLDAMHFFRSGGTIELMAELPVAYAQLCDVPLVSKGGSYMGEAMCDRLLPGDGELPLREWIAALPDGCGIGLEVPNLARLDSLGVALHAKGAVEAARALGV